MNEGEGRPATGIQGTELLTLRHSLLLADALLQHPPACPSVGSEEVGAVQLEPAVGADSAPPSATVPFRTRLWCSSPEGSALINGVWQDIQREKKAPAKSISHGVVLTVLFGLCALLIGVATHGVLAGVSIALWLGAFTAHYAKAWLTVSYKKRGYRMTGRVEAGSVEGALHAHRDRTTRGVPDEPIQVDPALGTFVAECQSSLDSIPHASTAVTR